MSAVSDDESDYGALFERGHWIWSEEIQSLEFVSDVPEEEEVFIPVLKAPTGNIEFREDLDAIEQMRFRHRYQRKVKMGDPDIVTLQDLKDVALYTAPMNIMSSQLINMLHVPTTERFIRALILYCQYYLQVTQIMLHRQRQLATKLRTENCEKIESVMQENLQDLRLLCAKEYSSIVMGGAELKKFHHMGPQKKRSLTDRDAHLYETLLRMCVQIVWLALGRRHFNRLELEINRLFKTDTYNSAEHALKTGYMSKMSPEEKKVLLGCCGHHDKKLYSFSPMVNEVFCKRYIDYRLLGLGVIKYKNLPSRLKYMLGAISAPEETLVPNGITVGILGMPRTRFDTMLNPIAAQPTDMMSRLTLADGESGHDGADKDDSTPHKSERRATFTGAVRHSSPHVGHRKMSTFACSRKSVHQEVRKLFPDIELPPYELLCDRLPSAFPDTPAAIRPVPAAHRLKWQHRLDRMRKGRNRSRLF